jgi:hypothetical protein
VTEVVPRDALWPLAASLADEIAARRPEAIQGTVRAIWEAIDEPWVVSQRHGLAYTQLGNRGRPNTPLAARASGASAGSADHAFTAPDGRRRPSPGRLGDTRPASMS